jgi:predicted nucleic acid-binding protein
VSLYFLDSSSLVKRYVVESGTPWVQSITSPGANNRLIITRITWVEVLSALARRQREGSLSADDVNRVVQTLRYDLDIQYQIVELDRALAELAGELVRRHVLRAYDAIQLAAALRVQAALTSTRVSFVTADNRLTASAQAEGLMTDDPNQH